MSAIPTDIIEQLAAAKAARSSSSSTPSQKRQAKRAKAQQPQSARDAGTAGRRRQGMGIVIGSDSVARAQSLHDALLRKGLINQNQHDAAERYRDDYELSHGARGGDAGGVSLAGWERTPGQAQINAISRLRRANEVLGLDVSLFVAAVVHGEGLMTLAMRFGGQDGGEGSRGSRAGKRIGKAMKGALEALEAHYFGTKRAKASGAVSQESENP